MQKFNDSVEATEFVQALRGMLHDPRLVQWVQATDDNFDTDAFAALVDAQNAFSSVEDQLNNAN